MTQGCIPYSLYIYIYIYAYKVHYVAGVRRLKNLNVLGTDDTHW